MAELLSAKTENVYSATNLSQKLSRGSHTYNEVMTIAEILGYNVQFIKDNQYNYT